MGPRGGLSTGNFERQMKGALGMEHLSLKRLCGGGPMGSSFTRDPGRYVKKVFRMRAALSTGDPFQPRGTWYVGGGSYTGDFDG